MGLLPKQRLGMRLVDLVAPFADGAVFGSRFAGHAIGEGVYRRIEIIGTDGIDVGHHFLLSLLTQIFLGQTHGDALGIGTEPRLFVAEDARLGR